MTSLKFLGYLFVESWSSESGVQSWYTWAGSGQLRIKATVVLVSFQAHRVGSPLVVMVAFTIIEISLQPIGIDASRSRRPTFLGLKVALLVSAKLRTDKGFVYVVPMRIQSPVLHAVKQFAK